MELTETSPVPEAALPVAAFRAHLRAGTGFAEETVQDAVLVAFLRAALAAVEARSGRALLRRDFSLRLAGWDGPGAQWLPKAPVVALTGLWLVDAAGAEVALDLGDFALRRCAQGAELLPRGTFPALPERGGARVQFTAGFGADWTAVPADLAQAVMLLAAHYYEYRDETALEARCMPFGVSALLAPWRPVRLGARA